MDGPEGAGAFGLPCALCSQGQEHPTVFLGSPHLNTHRFTHEIIVHIHVASRHSKASGICEREKKSDSCLGLWSVLVRGGFQMPVEPPQGGRGCSLPEVPRVGVRPNQHACVPGTVLTYLKYNYRQHNRRTFCDHSSV